jgi:hypothetical protein
VKGKYSEEFTAQCKIKGSWRPRWNTAMHNLYKDINIVDDIKIRRLGWAGHIIRMEDESIPPPQKKDS